MAALVGIERRAAEIAGQIFVEFLFAAREARRVNGPHMFRLRQRIHQLVEAVRQRLYRVAATDRLIERDYLFSH